MQKITETSTIQLFNYQLTNQILSQKNVYSR